MATISSFERSKREIPRVAAPPQQQERRPLPVGRRRRGYDALIAGGLLYVCAEDGAHRIWPSEPDEWFFGDNTLISFPDKYFISTSPTELFIYAYNLDEAYDHKFQVRVGQVSDPVLIQSLLPSIQMETLTVDIEKIIEEQDQSRAASRERILAELDVMEGLPEETENGDS